MLVCLGVLFADPAAQAQDFGAVEETNTNVSSYFYFTQPGEATIEVKVMGTVGSPGLYRVGEGTDLGQLLALSGGPLMDVREEGRDRETTVRLFRPQSSGGRTLVFEKDFEEGLKTQGVSYPGLRDGDVMTVEVVEDQRFQWRDAVTILSAVGTVAFAIAQFVGN